MGKKLEKFDYTLITRESVIGVALSGGKDSISLFFTLLEYSKQFPITLKAINVEHGIRDNSINDSHFVEDICKKHNIELLTKKVDAKQFALDNKMSLEQGARVLRYQFFEQLISENKVQYIALGHHKNDSVETTLFNIFRGSGIKGAAGIFDRRNNYIRPMLNVSREEIDDYINSNALPFVVDESNFDNSYNRNYIRNQVIPIISQRFPSAVDNIYNFSLNLKNDLYALDQLGKSIVKLHGDTPYIEVSDLAYDAISVRAYFYALSLLNVTHEIYSKNIKQLLLLKEKQNGSRIDLTKGISVYLDYDKVVFEKKYSILPFNREVTEGEFIYNNAKYTLKFVDKFEKIPHSIAIDFDKLPQNAIIRNRCDGDVFLRCCGSTKLKKYLIDKKIPQRLRDYMLFIASGSEILAVIPNECGQKLFIDDNTKKILMITKKQAGIYNE